MQIILTHEQADFDALASLLGAYLINDSYTPVLPRRMNRNVRAFLTLYGEDLPFADPRDLPQEAITDVILVDTQSMVSLRGMSDATRVHIIDHHPLRDDLPPDWKITVSGTGANTTLFVDVLHEREIAATMVQCTLLLLGIYEDTGSLTYDRTTARDLRAASYLLEQGASLQVAADFLNHPLSLSQQSIYDFLRENAETHVIHGHTVVITSCDAKGTDEELSTIAHKLRDFMDPDALCVLVITRGGVQLIARSTSKNIDVGALAVYFGGGGHERAAASLIKDKDLDTVYRELVNILPQFVQPAVKVAQIMSTNPQLLSPDTTAQEAAERMQRFGYEGFPVVHSGKLVGLLTRRAGDRAGLHRYKSTAGMLMEPGEFTVAPDDSIEYLQRLMTETGWGQVPVINPQDNQIIGIVTRTDLLKVLTPRPRILERQKVDDRLERALPAERLELLKKVAEIAHQKHMAVYIVGGFVRDLLLNTPNLDFDLVVEGDAIKLARQLAKTYGGRLISHARFGTAKWYPGDTGSLEPINSKWTPDSSIDLVTARTEFYTHPSALPTVERGSIKLDLHRRDFTINTLALRLDGRYYGDLYDYWGGLSDLKRGIVRVLHSLSFVDDPTRILRAIRFEKRFDFKIDNRTLELLREALPLVDRVSGDRLRHELDAILKENKTIQMIARLSELGILDAIHPALGWDDWLKGNLQKVFDRHPDVSWGFPEDFVGSRMQRDVIYTIWMLRLTQADTQSVFSRLKCSAALVSIILQAQSIYKTLGSLIEARPSQVVDQMEGISPASLYAISLCSEDIRLAEQISRYMHEWRHIRPKTRGPDLRMMGVAPGPAYKEILKALRDAWLNGQITNETQEKAFLLKLLARKIA